MLREEITMDFMGLAERLGLEEDEFLELVALFVEKSTSDLGRLESAIDRADIGQVVETSHSIKGAAGNLGFMEIYDIAKEVEMDARQDIVESAPRAVELLREKVDLIRERLSK